MFATQIARSAGNPARPFPNPVRVVQRAFRERGRVVTSHGGRRRSWRPRRSRCPRRFRPDRPARATLPHVPIPVRCARASHRRRRPRPSLGRSSTLPSAEPKRCPPHESAAEGSLNCGSIDETCPRRPCATHRGRGIRRRVRSACALRGRCCEERFARSGIDPRHRCGRRRGCRPRSIRRRTRSGPAESRRRDVVDDATVIRVDDRDRVRSDGHRRLTIPKEESRDHCQDERGADCRSRDRRGTPPQRHHRRNRRRLCAGAKRRKLGG